MTLITLLVIFKLVFPVTYGILFLKQVARLETQVIRFKTSAETAERSEEELKTERRKLQREVRFFFFFRQIDDFTNFFYDLFFPES